MSVFGGMARGAYEKIAAKTGSYQVTKGDLGTLFTTRGASGAVTFTLPKMSELQAGWNCWFYNVADQNMIVAAATDDADKMATLNDPTADSVALQTTSEKVGGGFWVVYDGTGWLVFTLAEETQTVTVATA